jgi:hypothetical protein
LSDDKSKLPKLTPLQLSIYVGDLLLISEGSIESVRHNTVRRAWHVGVFFYYHIFGHNFFLNGIVSRFISEEVFPTVTTVYRYTFLVFYLWFLGSLVYLAFVHYKFLMVTGKDLRSINVVFFFLIINYVFGLCYQEIYFINPDTFNYPHPIAEVATTLKNFDLLTRWQFSADFTLYSACTAVTLGYPRISSASAIVSLFQFLSGCRYFPYWCVARGDVRAEEYFKRRRD